MNLTTMNLTIQDLRAKHACSDQVALFKQHFGDGGEVTLEKVLGVATLFNWDWAAQALLSPAAQAEYERVHASAQAEYARVLALAQAEYQRVRASAWAEYERVRASAWYAGWASDRA